MNKYIIYYTKDGNKIFSEIGVSDTSVANSIAFKLTDDGCFGVIGLATDKLRGIYL